MSLDNPSKFEKALTAWEGFGYKRYIVYGVLALVVLAGVLYSVDRFSNWSSSRKLDKLKTNVNATMQDLQNAQGNVARAKQDEAVQLDRVKRATNELVTATNATDTAKAETNRALENLSRAVNANRPVDITGEELQKRIKELKE